MIDFKKIDLICIFIRYLIITNLIFKAYDHRVHLFKRVINDAAALKGSP